MESIATSVGTSLVGKLLSSKGKKQSSNIANMIVPKNINTGNSNYNTSTGQFELDPSIRASQDAYTNALGGLRGDITSAYDSNRAGLSGLSGQVDGMRADYLGNQSAYENSMLNPLRQNIATRSGALDRELGRTGVRGSFANQAKTNFSIDSGRSLTDAKAQIENQRINKLGDFLQMDADILKQGLASDTGRIGMIASLEQSISSVGMERFNQEMQMLGLPAQYVGAGQAQANMAANAQGIDNKATAGLAGSLIEGLGSVFGGNTQTPLDQNNPFMNTDYDIDAGINL